MTDLNFRIAPDAVEYLKSRLQRGRRDEALVLVVAPMSEAKHSPVEHDELSRKEIRGLANEYLKSLPEAVVFKWTVGIMQRSRLPKRDLADIRVVDEIECFIPDDLQPTLRGRVLRLMNGELVFDPELEPPPVQALPREDLAKNLTDYLKGK